VFQPKIKIERALYERLMRVADSAGYSSVDEFVLHLLEKAAADGEAGDAESEEAVRKRLQGLGYID
jgi:hypothetical protein